MALEEIVGCILKGTLAERPAHAAYLNGYLYYVLSGPGEGDLYWNNGSAWVMLQGASKTEVLQNKTLLASQNNINGIPIDPFISNRRDGWITPGLTAADSLKGCLKGLPSLGSYSLVYDTNEGWISRFSTSAIEPMGWYSTVLPVITRREWNPKLKVKAKSSTITNLNMWFGFMNTNIALANNPQPNGSHCILVGGGSGFSSVYYSIRNDGTNDVGAHTSLVNARDTSFNTFDIEMSETNITVKLNNNTPVVLTTRLPALTQDLYLFIHYWSRDTVAKTFDIAKVYFSSDVT